MVYYCRALFLMQINDANFTSHNCIFVFRNVCIVIPTSAISLIFENICYVKILYIRLLRSVNINTMKNTSTKHIYLNTFDEIIFILVIAVCVTKYFIFFKTLHYKYFGNMKIPFVQYIKTKYRMRFSYLVLYYMQRELLPAQLY